MKSKKYRLLKEDFVHQWSAPPACSCTYTRGCEIFLLNLVCFSPKITLLNSDLNQIQEVSRNHAEDKVDLNIFGMESHLQRAKLALEIVSCQVYPEAGIDLGWTRSLLALKIDSKSNPILGLEIDWYLPSIIALVFAGFLTILCYPYPLISPRRLKSSASISDMKVPFSIFETYLLSELQRWIWHGICAKFIWFIGPNFLLPSSTTFGEFSLLMWMLIGHTLFQEKCRSSAYWNADIALACSAILDWWKAD